MFWSGNYIAVRELNSLLKEENVTLSQVLEADDILQECKADNKALMLFLTRPDILNELITLITEEPPKNVELSQQYRHANIACEVLTSHLSMLSDRLSSDTVQMNRLCDFVNREPPLNPLLASYFSKTVEMLLEKSPKQDCYLYHIVCLRVLDFFKSRRDFLPNLLRHISTSAIADVFKYFIRLDDLFNKIVMEWFDEHQVLDSLIQIMCGSYGGAETDTAAEPERDRAEAAEKEDLNHNQGEDSADATRETARARAAARRARVGADNACALLAGVAGAGGAAAGGEAASRTGGALAARLASADGVARLLAAAFTAEGAARGRAAAHAALLLLQLLRAAPDAAAALQLAVAPHLPLLHHALLHPPPDGPPAAGRPRVGYARLQIAALVAELTLSPVHEVCTTLLALGTPGVLLDMLVQFPDNNFLHSSVVTMVRNALCANPVYCTQYAEHLYGECDMLNRFMDLYEENENKEAGARRGHAGHVAQALWGAAAGPPPQLPRFAAFLERTLRPRMQLLDTPLGGTHPAENIYEVDCIMDTLAANFDFSDMAATSNMEDGSDDLTNENECGVADSHADSPDFLADGLGLRDDDDDHHQMNKAKSSFLELANQRFDDDMWDDTPEEDAEGEEGEGERGADVHDVLNDFSPWASGPTGSGGGGEGWASFEPPPAPAAPAAPVSAPADFDAPFTPFWPYELTEQQAAVSGITQGMAALSLAAQHRAQAQAVAATLGSDVAATLASNVARAVAALSPAARATLGRHAAPADAFPTLALDDILSVQRGPPNEHTPPFENTPPPENTSSVENTPPPENILSAEIIPPVANIPPAENTPPVENDLPRDNTPILKTPENSSPSKKSSDLGTTISESEVDRSTPDRNENDEIPEKTTLPKETEPSPSNSKLDIPPTIEAEPGTKEGDPSVPDDTSDNPAESER